MLKLLKKLGNWVDPNYWAEKIGDTTGAYDKANSSSLAEWSRNLTGWKWWAWQIVGGVIGLVVIEFFLNMVGISILPWRW
jgi:hypothetical protein|tara:strand:+ start:425 stop:664 length:240 start_codon:yes stop_codon:yes gene_type:complete